MQVETDREKYAIQRIVGFYAAQPTNYADYFEAAWRYKYRIALKKPHATLATTAADAKVEPGIPAHGVADPARPECGRPGAQAAENVAGPAPSRCGSDRGAAGKMHGKCAIS